MIEEFILAIIVAGLALAGLVVYISAGLRDKADRRKARDLSEAGVEITPAPDKEEFEARLKWVMSKACETRHPLDMCNYLIMLIEDNQRFYVERGGYAAGHDNLIRVAKDLRLSITKALTRFEKVDMPEPKRKLRDVYLSQPETQPTTQPFDKDGSNKPIRGRLDPDPIADDDSSLGGDDEEQQRRDEKNGLYPGKEDPAN